MIENWLNRPAPFLFAPIMFGLFLAVASVIFLLRERFHDRTRKEEEARRNQAKPV